MPRSVKKSDLPQKLCATCGRPFSWRKASAESWDEVRYCSRGCRTHKPGPTDRALESALLDALRTEPVIATEDAALAVGGEDWQPLAERARRAARRLAAAGAVDLVQHGRRIGPNAKGSFAVRRPRR